MKLIPIKVINTKYKKKISKPSWIKIKFSKKLDNIKNIKNIIKVNKLNSVCVEASCPNLPECFSNNTVTFMILGNICTRKCTFCDVKYGRPNIPDINEPKKLANVIYKINLKYVVITSVDRDDLHDGGAKHFIKCINSIRKKNPNILIEILVPDFRGRMKYALNILNTSPPDVFNHNIETVPRLYNSLRPGANYYKSLELLENFKNTNINIPTKSGLMLGLGEKKKEIYKVMRDLRSHGVTMITIGQYLQPSIYHIPVLRYLTIKEFDQIKKEALKMNFTNVFSGPLIRSSYNAELQFKII